MNVTVKQAVKRLDEFVKMSRSICKDPDVANDLVQDLFLKLCEIEKNEGSLDRLSYFNKAKDKLEINTFYCFRIMTNVYLDLVRRDKIIYVSSISESDELLATEDPTATELEYQESKDSLLKEVEESSQELHWYDAKIFEHYMFDVKSVRELSALTGISHTSIYNTICNVKEAIKDQTRPSKIRNYYRAKNSLD